MYYFFIFALLLKLNASTTPEISAENILEIKFHSVCMPTRIAPEAFNDVMKELYSAAAVSSSKRFSSVDRALSALENLAVDSEYAGSIKALLMPFADFTRSLNRYRPVLVSHGEEVAPEDPLIANRERAFNTIAAALFDFKDSSTLETARKFFSAGQSPQSLTIGVDGRILSFTGTVVDESTLPEKGFYPHVRQATTEFIASILRIWDSQFMRELITNKRVTVTKSKILADKKLTAVDLVGKKPAANPSLSAAAYANEKEESEESDDGFVYVDGDGKGTAHFTPDPLPLVVKSTSLSTQ